MRHDGLVVLALTAIGNDVTFPSGTSSPQLDDLDGSMIFEHRRGIGGMFLVLLSVGGGYCCDKSIYVAHCSLLAV
jgi:hypothetical protein